MAPLLSTGPLSSLCAISILHRKSPSPLPSSVPGISIADSFASFFTDKISKFRLSLDSSYTTHLHAYLLLLKHLLISPLSTPPLHLKSTRFFQTALRRSLIPFPSLPGFSKNVHLSLSAQSLILLICRSLPVSSTFHPILKEFIYPLL